MNSHYEPYWHQAMELRGKTHALIGDSEHPVAHSLRQDTSLLVEDIEMDRHPDRINERIDGIQQRLSQARTMGDEVLDVPANRRLRTSYEQVRDGIMQWPHR